MNAQYIFLQWYQHSECRCGRTRKPLSHHGIVGVHPLTLQVGSTNELLLLHYSSHLPTFSPTLPHTAVCWPPGSAIEQHPQLQAQSDSKYIKIMHRTCQIPLETCKHFPKYAKYHSRHFKDHPKHVRTHVWLPHHNTPKTCQNTTQKAKHCPKI